jgi:drug/metabolite transporter (DMT)-like permease
MRFNSPSRAGAYLALVVTTLFWGSNPAVSRLLLERMSPMALVWCRWLLVVVMLLPFVWPERAAIAHALRRDWRRFLPFALLGFAPQNMLIFFGLAGSSAMHLALLNSAIPVLIILIGWLWLDRAPRRLESIGLAMSLAGVLLIVARGDFGALARLDLNPWDLALFGGMAVWAVYTIRLRERPATLSLPAFVFVAAVIGNVVTLPFAAAALARDGLPDLHGPSFAALLYVAALPTLLAMVLFGHAVQRVGPVQAGIFTHLVPVFGAAFAALLVGEALRPYHGIGFLLVAGGAIVSCLPADRVLSSRPPTRG